MKCTCGVGDVFYSHLHEKGCPCADDREMKAPPSQVEKLQATVEKQAELLRRAHDIFDEMAVATSRMNELRCDLVDAGYVSTVERDAKDQRIEELERELSNRQERIRVLLERLSTDNSFLDGDAKESAES